MRFINIIDSGSTIILLHRANKNGGHYQGSNDIRNSEMSKHKKGFTNEVKKMLNQNELLGWLEHKKDDKTTKGILDKFGNVFWSRYKEKNVWYYSTCPKIGTYDSISV
jgi:hypothetical protein